jgi:hypothetical protein
VLDFSLIAQAMEICGGARADCEENRFASGEAAGDSAMRASTSRTNAAVVVGCVCAH